MPIKIETDKYLRESIVYADNSFPFGVFTDDYAKFSDRTLNCHWHYDFEFSIVLSGAIDYCINDTYMQLRQGDCIFVNSNMLHMGSQEENSGRTVMFTVTFPTTLLAADSSSRIFMKYLQPVLSSRIEGFKTASDDPYGEEVRSRLMEISDHKYSRPVYELECLNLAGQLWRATYRYIEEHKDNLLWRLGNTQNAERMKEILSYIHQNYDKKITVEAMAQYANVSRAECFRCFKRFMNKRPVEYINEYRLLKAAALLRETEMSVTEVYLECGFENASYFSKVFKDRYMASPMRYRKQ